ncbi:hypothetical protein MHH85_09625 [Viridibacillus sp. FSL E2-0187]|uniref:hypothetical protein n=1 Tax=Viridibacillus sp. FSL E2-0187 TaxID=2921362 RepID=UPI0030FB41BB
MSKKNQFSQIVVRKLEIQGDYKAAERALFKTISLANEGEENQILPNYCNNIYLLCIKEVEINESFIFGKKDFYLNKKYKKKILYLNLQFIQN